MNISLKQILNEILILNNILIMKPLTYELPVIQLPQFCVRCDSSYCIPGAMAPGLQRQMEQPLEDPFPSSSLGIYAN